MDLASRWRALAATAGVSLALTGAGVFAAGAPASRAHAAGTASCGNHSFTLTIEVPEQPAEKIKVQAKNIKATGLSCKAAVKFVGALYNSKSGTPEHFKCKTGKAKEPRGYFPQVCTRGSKKVEYGAQGG